MDEIRSDSDKLGGADCTVGGQSPCPLAGCSVFADESAEFKAGLRLGIFESLRNDSLPVEVAF